MLEAIQVFIRVAELGSFSKAAQALGTSTSSASRSVSKLEQHLCATLVKRSTRSLTLTRQGEKFLEKASRLFSEISLACQEIRDDSDGVTGSLKISTFESFGRLFVSRAAAAFASNHPGVQVEVMVDNALSDLYREEVDVAIRIGIPQDSGLRARKLVSNQMVLCASPQYIAKAPCPATPHDLANHNCLLIGRNKHQGVWHFANERESTRVQVRGNLCSQGGTPLWEAALMGVGVTLLPQWMIGPELRDGKLVRLLPDWRADLNDGGSGEIHALYRNDAYQKAPVRLFIDQLVSTVQTSLALSHDASLGRPSNAAAPPP